jgi:hypothetical protein
MRCYVFTEDDAGKETIHYESKFVESLKAEKECVEWVHKNCQDCGDHWELNGEWVGLMN